MPAAAVIPAPKAYIKVVAVKKLVVEIEDMPFVIINDINIEASFIVMYIGDVLNLNVIQ